MYCKLYRFQVKPGMRDEFISAWTEMTELIYEYEGSLGSRLHSDGSDNYYAYAQWPSQAHFENAGDSLPEKAGEMRKRMRNSCDKIEALHGFEVSKDLLKEFPHESK